MRPWLFVGDSITYGIRHTHGRRHYVQLVEEHVRKTIPERVFINAGMDAGTTEEFSGNPINVIEQFRPEVLSVMFGVNDAKARFEGLAGYRKRLDEIVQRGMGVGAMVVLHVPTPVFGVQRTGLRSSLPDYADVARSVGSGALVVDHPAVWVGVDETQLMDDDIHPNGCGHELVARTMLEAMEL